MSRKECKCNLRTRLVGDGCEICNPEMVIEILRDRLEEAEADARRYRWLRDNSYVFGSHDPCGELPDEPVSMWLLGSTDMTDGGVDAAIDAELAKEAK